jgi:hypothetical protein
LLEIDKSEFTELTTELNLVAEQISTMAQACQGDALKLLHILRVLEKLHSQISDELFQPALPNTRHGLFDLLREMESNGGWPYIYRLRLRELCQNLEAFELLALNSPLESQLELQAESHP